jgi:hypothetical protein
MGRRTRPRGACYLVCLPVPYKHLRHYLGHADPDLRGAPESVLAAEIAASMSAAGLLPAEAAGVARRVTQHRNGTGANCLAYVVADGLTFDIVRVWPGATRKTEAWLKDLKAHTLLCPRCTPGTTRAVKPGAKARRRPRRRPVVAAADAVPELLAPAWSM